MHVHDHRQHITFTLHQTYGAVSHVDIKAIKPYATEAVLNLSKSKTEVLRRFAHSQGMLKKRQHQSCSTRLGHLYHLYPTQ